MKLNRNWTTPLAAGAFLLSAVTGVLIFFHLDIGLNKIAHEWLSWILLAGVVLHVVTNLAAFKRHFSSKAGLGVMGLFALVLALSFITLGEKREPPFIASVRALSNAPLSTLALVAHQTPEELKGILVAEGLHPSSDEQNLRELAGPDVRQQARLLEKLFKKRDQRPVATTEHTLNR